MTCAECGSEQGAGAQFCARCGSRIAPAAGFDAMPYAMPGPAASYAGAGFMVEQRTRVQQNLQTLGVLWCLYGGYRVLRGLIVEFTVHALMQQGVFGGKPWIPHLVSSLTPVIAVLSIVMGALSAATGAALLARKSWARPLALVMASLSLLKLPVGTALGIFTLWVLAPSPAGAEWERMQQA